MHVAIHCQCMIFTVCCTMALFLLGVLVVGPLSLLHAKKNCNATQSLHEHAVLN